MLSSVSSGQIAWTAAAVCLGALGGILAGRIAVCYVSGLRKGAFPDFRLMLQSLVAALCGGSQTSILLHEHIMRWSGRVAMLVLAVVYGSLSLQTMPALQMTAWMIFAFVLVLLACIDRLCGLLPDALTLPLLLLGVAFAGTGYSEPGLMESATCAGILYGLLSGLAWLFHRLRGLDGLGGGDVKCIAALASWSGFEGIFSILLLASLSGVAYALIFRRPASLSQAYPFGPCLVFAALIWLVCLRQA